jgi:predicted CoA-substrate-specific enzyme activase
MNHKENIGVYDLTFAISCGVDVGSLTTKAVLLKDHEVLSYSVILSSEKSEVISKKAIDETLKKADLGINDVQYIVSTGAGRKEVPFANESVTTPLAVSVGAVQIFPTARTVIDIGAENCVVVTCNEMGQVTNFIMHDKCAAGTGSFLETMAESLEVGLEDMGQLSLKSQNKVNISSMCTVFAESEVIGYVHMGTNKVDIISGLHDAVSLRVFGMLNKIRFKKDLVMVGGVAKNIGVVSSLKNMIGLDILVPENPQIVGALGAAIFACNSAKDVGE